MTTLVADVRHGVRVLLRAPGFTLAAVLLLALGFGATTALFSVVHALLVEPLPYPQPERLVMVWEHNLPRDRPRNLVGPANYLRWRERTQTIEGLAFISQGRRILTGIGDPVEVPTLGVSANFFEVFAVRPALGRAFSEGEDAPPARRAVLSHGLWTRAFGQRTDVVGQTLMADGLPVEIVGVAPEGFEVIGLPADLYVPTNLGPEVRDFRGRYGIVVGRLGPGVQPAQAHEELKTIAAGIAEERPEANTGWTTNVIPLHEQVVGDLRLPLLVLFGAVVVVLLIACANVANLVLARAASRQREFAVRASLGAGSRRLAQQLVVEGLLLSLAGAVVGVGLAVWLTGALVAVGDTALSLPMLDRIAVDGTALLFTAGAVVLTTVLCGLAPAWGVAGFSLTEALREGTHQLAGAPRGRRLRSALVAAEVALAVALLVGGGLLLRSLVALTRIDPGFTPDSVLSLRVILPDGAYPEEAQWVQFQDRLVERFEALPGVSAAAGTVFLPMAGLGSATSFWLADAPEPPAGEKPVADIRPVTPNYFRTLGIPLLAGRDFERRDTSEAPLVAVVNETFARRHYPGENPIGRALIYSWAGPTRVEIVGVVGDVRLVTLDGEIRETVYLPHTQNRFDGMNFVLRTTGDPEALSSAAVAAVREIDPNQPVSVVRTLDAVLANSLARPRLTATAAGTFSLVALILAIVGVYSVVAYGVTMRSREFGVRLALGAQGQDIVRLVLRQSLATVAIGLGIGLALAWGLAQALESLLYNVQPEDPLTFGGIVVLLLAVATLATLGPAWRGTRVDPLEALRAE